MSDDDKIATENACTVPGDSAVKTDCPNETGNETVNLDVDPDVSTVETGKS